jgi:Rrf2 family protein
MNYFETKLCARQPPGKEQSADIGVEAAGQDKTSANGIKHHRTKILTGKSKNVLHLYCNILYYSINPPSMTNNRLTIAIHIMTLLASTKETWLPSEMIAGSMNIHPVLVRKELANLKRNGLIMSKEGKNGGSALALPPNQILLSRIYQVVREGALLGGNKHDPNPDCPVGKRINLHLAELYRTAEEALVQRLGKTTLASFSRQFN